MRIIRRVALVLLALCMAFAMSACGDSDTTKEDATTTTTNKTDAATEAATGSEDPIMIQIEMQDGGIMNLELYPAIAPITVANFVKLAKEGFYDGLIFHRVVKGFMIQGGDPTGTGYNGSDETIKGEFTANGVNNTLSHKRGVISMARSQSYNSASSQFFIVHADSTFLDGQYAAFGMLTEGFDVLDKIATTPVNGEKPVTAQTIKAITVIE